MMELNLMNVDQLSGDVIRAAMKVHSALGPGLLEGVYEACLVHELCKEGMDVVSQVLMPVEYDGQRIDAGYRVDMVVENTLLVELKAVQALLPIHEAQLLSYLRLSGKEVGLLMNFNVEHLRDGIRRLVNTYRSPAGP